MNKNFATLFIGLCLGANALGEDLVPVIYAPGMGVPASITRDFKPVFTQFKKHGYEFMVSMGPTGKSIEARSAILMSEINRLVPAGKKFHIVAHSMGGLDARLAIQRYNIGDRVLSLTTISTPHRGSELADKLVENGDNPSSNPLSQALKKEFKDFGDAGRDLTTAHMKIFNSQVFDDPRVAYYSLGYYIPEPVMFHAISALSWWTWSIIKDRGAPLNDSMVSVESSQWGIYLGSFQGEHIAQTLPVLYDAHFIYKQNYDRVINNLDKNFR